MQHEVHPGQRGLQRSFIARKQKHIHDAGDCHVERECSANLTDKPGFIAGKHVDADTYIKCCREDVAFNRKEAEEVRNVTPLGYALDELGPDSSDSQEPNDTPYDAQCNATIHMFSISLLKQTPRQRSARRSARICCSVTGVSG
jgi:hypothetical protein